MGIIHSHSNHPVRKWHRGMDLGHDGFTLRHCLWERRIHVASGMEHHLEQFVVQTLLAQQMDYYCITDKGSPSSLIEFTVIIYNDS